MSFYLTPSVLQFVFRDVLLFDPIRVALRVVLMSNAFDPFRVGLRVFLVFVYLRPFSVAFRVSLSQDMLLQEVVIKLIQFSCSNML